MLARHAVPLTAPEAEPRLHRLEQFWCNVSPLAATLIVPPVSVANKRLTAWLNPLDATLTKNRGRGAVMVNQLPLGFGDSTFRRSDPPTFQRTLHLLLSLFEQRVFENPFEIKRFRTLSKNSRVYGIASHSGTRFFHQSRACSDLVGVTSPATLFHPWLANASANISSPISIGAKRSRVPFAFRRIPLSRFTRTISIVGSKLVRGMVK